MTKLISMQELCRDDHTDKNAWEKKSVFNPAMSSENGSKSGMTTKLPERHAWHRCQRHRQNGRTVCVVTEEAETYPSPVAGHRMRREGCKRILCPLLKQITALLDTECAQTAENAFCVHKAPHVHIERLVSMPAPTRGSIRRLSKTSLFEEFQSTPPRRERLFPWDLTYHGIVSIHAPA